MLMNEIYTLFYLLLFLNKGLVYLPFLFVYLLTICLCSLRCVYPDRSRQSGNAGWFLWLLWSCSRISMPAGFSEYKCMYRSAHDVLQ